MKRVLRISALVAGAFLLAAQFVRHAPNAGSAEGARSLVAVEAVPEPVRATLQRACYDCHSNRTKYPWYAQVQPAAWWLNKHVTEGKTELNLSEFAAYDSKRSVRKLQAIADEVRDRHMPLPSYLLMHREAKLTDADVSLIVEWAEVLAEEIGSR